jgi:3'(2'), 5'-bisphosphate nucleotidase
MWTATRRKPSSSTSRPPSDDSFWRRRGHAHGCADTAGGRSKERVWVVDPIDGTRGFAMKNGEFSVMVGLVDRGRLAVGVVMEPERQRLTYATQGGGCYHGRGGVARALPRHDHGDAGRRDVHQEPLERVGRRSRTDERWPGWSRSASTRRGSSWRWSRAATRTSTSIAIRISTTGTSARAAPVEEAGGRVTTLGGRNVIYGRPGADQRNGLLASNGVLHDARWQRCGGP